MLLIAFVSATAANVLAIGNALAARDNCRRIAVHSDRTRDLLIESLRPAKEGELDSDYQQIYGFERTEYKGETFPYWQVVKMRQVDRTEAEIAKFTPVDCTITIVRWIKGD